MDAKLFLALGCASALAFCGSFVVVCLLLQRKVLTHDEQAGSNFGFWVRVAAGGLVAMSLFLVAGFMIWTLYVK